MKPAPIVPTVAAHPELERAGLWATRHGDLLAACFARFEREAAWPLLEDLQHDFERRGEVLDVARAAFDMPKAIGFVEIERLVLRTRGLAYVPAAQWLLEGWHAAIALAYERWLQDPRARLTSDDVHELLGGDAHRTRLVSLVLLRESWPFGSGHGDGTQWSRELHSTVRIAELQLRACGEELARGAGAASWRFNRACWRGAWSRRRLTTST
jgi:hypothetical protein